MAAIIRIGRSVRNMSSGMEFNSATGLLLPGETRLYKQSLQLANNFETYAARSGALMTATTAASPKKRTAVNILTSAMCFWKKAVSFWDVNPRYVRKKTRMRGAMNARL